MQDNIPGAPCALTPTYHAFLHPCECVSISYDTTVTIDSGTVPAGAQKVLACVHAKRTGGTGTIAESLIYYDGVEKAHCYASTMDLCTGCSVDFDAAEGNKLLELKLRTQFFGCTCEGCGDAWYTT